jgi:D-sedoheptulose 7-phosphate isomerase
MRAQKKYKQSDEIKLILNESILTIKAIIDKRVKEIEIIAELIIKAYKSGGKVILLGNGGSAADAQHIAAELVGKFALKRRAFPAIALTTNSSILTAVANDYGYGNIFSRQVEALSGDNDVVIAISTSGGSVNVIKAIKAARLIGARTVGLTGGDGGILASVVDVALIVPSNCTPRIQEAHTLIGHIICELVEKELVSGL